MTALRRLALLPVVFALVGCGVTVDAALDDFLLTPEQRCQQARDTRAGIEEPTTSDRWLAVAACAQARL